MDNELRASIIVAAVSATQPNEDEATWMTDVAENAGRITAMLSDRSRVAKVVESVAGSKVFSGTITKLELEKSSQRVIVHLETKPSKDNPDGQETVRSERRDTPLGLRMSRRLKELKGHRVMLWVDVQEIQNSNRKVRVLSHIEDLDATV